MPESNDKIFLSIRLSNCFFGLVECVCESTRTDKSLLPRKRKAPSCFEIRHSEGYHA